MTQSPAAPPNTPSPLTVELLGVPRLLAEGSRAAAARVGQGSDAWAMHVKGLAVAARGACHNRSSAYDVDLSDRLDPAAAARARAEAATAEDQAALLDSLTLCKFLRRAIGDIHEEGAALHRAVTGLPATPDYLAAAGARALDALPPCLLESKGNDLVITPDWLDRQIAAYYAVRGWNDEGRPVSRI